MSFLWKRKVDKTLGGLEARMGGQFPPELTAILEVAEGLRLGPCRFSSPEAIASLLGRVTGWPPEVIPFAITGPDSYGLMRVPGEPPTAWPVVLALGQPPNIVPVSSSFRTFLFYLALQFEPSASDGKDIDLARKTLVGLGVPERLFTQNVPGPMMPEELLNYDKNALAARCVMALRRASGSDIQMAVKGLLGLAKEAPWWGAPHYLMGRLFRFRDDVRNACGCYWNAIERPCCHSGFSSRAGYGDMGIGENAEADAVAYLREHEDALPAPVRSHFRWQALRDPAGATDPERRLEIARQYMAAGGAERALWALLDAVYLARGEPAKAESALHEMGAAYESLGRNYEAWVCLAGVPRASGNYNV